jgi:hypothetical protein
MVHGPSTSTAPRAAAAPAASDRCLGPIARVRGIGRREFYREFIKGDRPVILEGAIGDWRALTDWTWDFFRTKYGQTKVTCGRCFDKSWKTTFAEYFDYVERLKRGQTDEPEHGPPYYMEGWYFRRVAPELDRDWSMPEVFGTDWFEYLPDKWDPKGTGILIGPAGCFTKLHYDLMGTHSWNAQLQGVKRWILAAPGQTDAIYWDTRQGPGYYPGTDLDAPDLERYPRLADVRYYEGIVRPGEMIFFPARWLHQVTTLEDSVSLTHNFVSANNALSVSRMYVLNRLGKKNL